MKTLLALAVLCTAAQAQSVRFTGQGVGATSRVPLADPDGYGRLRGAYMRLSSGLALALPDPTWSFDVTTDGESVHITNATVTTTGTVQLNPLVSLDITATAHIYETTVDLTPTNTLVWDVARHDYASLEVSGTYYGIGQPQPFSGTMGETSLTGTGFSQDHSRFGLLDFTDWPAALDWNAKSVWQFIPSVDELVHLSSEPRKFSGAVEIAPDLSIDQIELWEPISVRLTPPGQTISPDANNDGYVLGDDLLALQRSGSLGIAGWQAAFTAPAAISSVPEPTALVLVVMGFGLLNYSDKRRAI